MSIWCSSCGFLVKLNILILLSSTTTILCVCVCVEKWTKGRNIIIYYLPQKFNWSRETSHGPTCSHNITMWLSTKFNTIITQHIFHNFTYLSLRNLTAFTGLGNSRIATCSFLRSSQITTEKTFTGSMLQNGWLAAYLYLWDTLDEVHLQLAPDNYIETTSPHNLVHRLQNLLKK